MTDAQTDRMLEAHKFSPEGSIWAPESLQQVRGRLEFIDAHECDCGETPHESALHDLAHDDVPVLLKVIERQATEVERLREAVTAADSILSLLHHRGLVNSENNRRDVADVSERLARLRRSGR